MDDYSINESFIASVSLDKIIKESGLKTLYSPDDPSKILVCSSDVNRPGLVLSGFYECFDPKRIEIIGNAETVLLTQMPVELRRERLTDFFKLSPVAVVITHGNEVDPILLEVAEYFEVPVLWTTENTSDFMAALISYLHVQLAPQITRHGVFVEVYGEGMLITGDSGIGKSETAIELIKRGHRLIADDAVELRKVSNKTIVGNAPEIIKYYIELRGIGVVDVRRLFGMGSVKETEKIDIIIRLEPWIEGKMYANIGNDAEYTDIMGVKIPTTTVPVKPGRNLAVVLEIAAMNNRQKKMGYNTAEEFNKRLLAGMEQE